MPKPSKPSTIRSTSVMTNARNGCRKTSIRPSSTSNRSPICSPTLPNAGLGNLPDVPNQTNPAALGGCLLSIGPFNCGLCHAPFGLTAQQTGHARPVRTSRGCRNEPSAAAKSVPVRHWIGVYEARWSKPRIRLTFPRDYLFISLITHTTVSRCETPTSTYCCITTSPNLLIVTAKSSRA